MKRYKNKQKAIDLAIWQMSNHCYADDYGVIPTGNDQYMVIPKDDTSFDAHCFEQLPHDYARMDYDHIRQIYSDIDPLDHWESIRGMFSTVHGEILRFLLNTRIPLDKFIRYELASRGYSEDFNWVGFNEAEKIWLK